MNTKLRARQSFQEDTEPSCGYIEATRLQPYIVRIGNPEFFVIGVGICDEMPAISGACIKTIGNTVERLDRHLIFPVLLELVGAAA